MIRSHWCSSTFFLMVSISLDPIVVFFSIGSALDVLCTFWIFLSHALLFPSHFKYEKNSFSLNAIVREGKKNNFILWEMGKSSSLWQKMRSAASFFSIFDVLHFKFNFNFEWKVIRCKTIKFSKSSLTTKNNCQRNFNKNFTTSAVAVC